MKVKFGSIVVAGRGKIGGHVASRNRAGAYWRTKVTPVNPATTYQQEVRNRLSGISSDWRGLTAAQRSSWNSAVADFAKTDIFGDIKNPSGFNLHQTLNNNLLICSESQISSPPAVAAVDAFTSLSIAASTGGQTLTLTFAAAIAADHKVLVFATPAQSPGKNFVKSEYRLVDVLDDGDTSPHSAETEYIARLGAIGAEGQKIFVKLVQVNTGTGQQGISISASCLIAA